jgi:geranylgeranyl diphosphate synthase type II
LAERPIEVPPAVRAQAVSMVAAAIGTEGMIGGQAADLEAEDQWPDDAVSALELIHRRKTGALLTASIRLGGLYAGATAEEDRRLGELGQRVGLLFQIGDDILDVEASTEALGKTAGKDAEARKLTYPGLFGLDESKRRLAQIGEEALELAGSFDGGSGSPLLASLVAYLISRDH